MRIVGPPGALSSSNVPPSIRTRSPIPTMPSRPRCAARASARADLEAVAVVRDPDLDRERRIRIRMSTLDAPECSRMFESDSWIAR